MKAARALLGDKITEQLPPKVWGLDTEGELNQTFRSSGHPGLWFAIGSFPFARFFSKHLVNYFYYQSIYLLINALTQGLQILAQEHGIA